MKRFLIIAAVAATLLQAPLALALDLQGHRGARGLAPENTLAAFRRALEIGVTTLETDLAVTSDGHLVLAHDPLLKGRVSVRINRPRPGDTAIDAQLDASPAFAGVSRYAYGRAGIQLFIETDLLKAGLLGDAMVLEFDYVFPGHDSHILSVVEL